MGVIVIAISMSLITILPARAQDKITILAFGDSLTHGFGLEQDAGFVAQLEGWLHDNGAPQVVVINAGVSGDTSAGGLARIDWALDVQVDAVIVELGGNDLLRGLSPEQTRKNLAGILDVVSARGLPVLLVGLPAPMNYGAQYKAAFDGNYPALAEKFGALHYPSFLQAIANDGMPGAGFMQADATHPNAAGVARIVADMGPVVLELLARVQ